MSRVDDLVVRDQDHPWPRAVTSGLRALRDAGYQRCPDVVEQPSDSKVLLTYMPGTALSDPVADWAADDVVLDRVSAFLLSFTYAAERISGQIPENDWIVPAPGARRIFAHGDPHPTNIVFDEHRRPVALIDFELATLATHGWNLVSFLFSWAPLEPVDLTCWRNATGLSPVARARRILESWRPLVDPALLPEIMDEYVSWRIRLFQTLARIGNPGAIAFVEQPAFRARHEHATTMMRTALRPPQLDLCRTDRSETT